MAIKLVLSDWVTYGIVHSIIPHAAMFVSYPCALASRTWQFSSFINCSWFLRIRSCIVKYLVQDKYYYVWICVALYKKPILKIILATMVVSHKIKQHKRLTAHNHNCHNAKNTRARAYAWCSNKINSCEHECQVCVNCIAIASNTLAEKQPHNRTPML